MAWSWSPAFRAALVAPVHTVVFRVDVLEAGVVVASSDVATAGRDLTGAGGGVNVARRAAIRRSADVTFGDATGALDPVRTGDLLDPVSGREFALHRGVLTDVGPELAPLGVFRIEDASVTADDGSTTVAISGSDRAAAVTGRGWPGTYRVAAGTPVGTAVLALVAARLPRTDFAARLSPTSAVTPSLTFGPDGDPMADAVSLAAGAGMELFFGPDGALVMQPLPDAATQPPVWRFLPGPENVRSWPVTKRIAGTTAVNGVVVRGSAPWLLFPVQGEAWDTNPASAFYYDPAQTDPVLVARMAEPNPLIVSDAIVGSSTQAQTVAAARLPEVLGVEEQIGFPARPVPGLDASDVIEVATATLGGTVRLVIDSLRDPLGVEEAMTIGCLRRRR